MTHQEIVDRVVRSAELPRRRSGEHAIRAVLETLAERADPEAAREVADKLPIETGVYLHDPPKPSGANVRTFEHYLDRVGGRLASTRPDTIRVSRAVIEAVRRAAGEEPVRRMQEKLPSSWEVLFEEKRIYAPRVAPPPPV